jgi:hypothetical protein
MARSDQPVQADPPAATDLEPYRRLVELQKEIAALAEQNERAQQKCAELREGVASGVIAQQTALRRKPRSKMSGALAQLPTGLALSGVLARILK